MSEYIVSAPPLTSPPPESLPPESLPPESLPPESQPPESQPPESPPPDVSLLLRAHAERRWLSREVIPVLRQIETSDDLPDDQLPAARAYLEVIWAEALGRARETDAERRRLDARDLSEQPLLARAHRYHRVVENLRQAVARRVAQLLAASQPRTAV